MSESSAEFDLTDMTPSALEERLVAYLDGELDEADSRRIESLLASDPKVRETLLNLQRTWELLDHLDRTPVDGHFTETTLEMVAIAAADDLAKRHEAAPSLRRRRFLAFAAAMAAATAVGFFGTLLLRPDPDAQLLRDLPVIEDLDSLRQIGDLDFLQRLHDEGLFAEDGADDA